MAFQFIHLETYSRKANKKGQSTSFIFGEADREKDCCLHVENPQPPKLVFGSSISELRAMHDDACASAKMINNKGQERGLRVDQNTLLTVVASHPFTPSECASSSEKMAEYEAWERETTQWLQKKYGPDLKTVVRHEDEGFMHIHAYVLPSDLKAFDLHPGVSAKRREKALALEAGQNGKTANKIGDDAYKKSMRLWQDSYYEEVAIKHGLARLGPKLRRLSREEWQSEKAQSAALKKAIERAKKVDQQVGKFLEDKKKQVSSFVRNEKKKFESQKSLALQDLQNIKAEFETVLDQLKVADNELKTLENTRIQAEKELEKLKVEAEEVTKVHSFFQSIIKVFKGKQIREEIRKEYDAKIHALSSMKSAAENKYNSIKQERDKLRKDLASSKASIELLASEKKQKLDAEKDQQKSQKMNSAMSTGRKGLRR